MVYAFILNLISNFKLIKNCKFQISNSRGITLIEIIVVIFIIALFSSILVSDFPTILREFALSRVTYKLAQDLRKTEDLGLSGLEITDIHGQSITAKGYGIYVDLSTSPAKQYLIYADIPDADGNYNQKYDGNFSTFFCNQVDINNLTSDCVIDIIDISQQNPSLFISKITDGSGNTLSVSGGVSINFSPPDPITNIEDNSLNKYSQIGIVLGLSTNSSATRTVLIDTSGLINVQ